MCVVVPAEHPGRVGQHPPRAGSETGRNAVISGSRKEKATDGAIAE
jgi:hypothetical protein